MCGGSGDSTSGGATGSGDGSGGSATTTGAGLPEAAPAAVSPSSGGGGGLALSEEAVAALQRSGVLVVEVDWLAGLDGVQASATL